MKIKGLHPVKAWSSAKIKILTELAMALGAMVGVSQSATLYEIRIKGQKHRPIWLLYASDFQHGVTWQDGTISHHTSTSEAQIVQHIAEWLEMGALP